MDHKALPLEREHLEVHVDLCEKRYVDLKKDVCELKNAVYDLREKNEEHRRYLTSEILSYKQSVLKAILGASATIIAGLLSTIVVVLIAFV